VILTLTSIIRELFKDSIAMPSNTPTSLAAVNAWITDSELLLLVMMIAESNSHGHLID